MSNILKQSIDHKLLFEVSIQGFQTLIHKLHSHVVCLLCGLQLCICQDIYSEWDRSSCGSSLMDLQGKYCLREPTCDTSSSTCSFLENHRKGMVLCGMSHMNPYKKAPKMCISKDQFYQFKRIPSPLSKQLNLVDLSDQDYFQFLVEESVEGRSPQYS